MEKDFNLFCLSLNNNQFQIIRDLNYIPVGLGESNFNELWLRDNQGENISEKNKYYGELTFHYWFWKNKLDLNSKKWFGFCHYRRFWNQKNQYHMMKTKHLNNQRLKFIPDEWKNYEIILLKPIFINKLKLSKVLKRGLKLIIRNPKLLIDENLRTINFHFDMWHGMKNLKETINLLEKEDRDDFNKFVNSEVSFNPYHMFFSNSPHLIDKYYKSVFLWLSKCEKLLGFKNLHGYETRIYAFLAERYMSYWFKKNSKYLEWSMLEHDISQDIT